MMTSVTLTPGAPTYLSGTEGDCRAQPWSEPAASHSRHRDGGDHRRAGVLDHGRGAALGLARSREGRDQRFKRERRRRSMRERGLLMTGERMRSFGIERL